MLLKQIKPSPSCTSSWVVDKEETYNLLLLGMPMSSIPDLLPKQLPKSDYAVDDQFKTFKEHLIHI